MVLPDGWCVATARAGNQIQISATIIPDVEAQPTSHLHVQQACSSQVVLAHTRQAFASGLISADEEVITLSPSFQMLVTHLSNNISQSRVAQQEPAPRRDPVCLVLKLLRLQLIEILEPGTPGSSEPPTATQSFSWAPHCMCSRLGAVSADLPVTTVNSLCCLSPPSSAVMPRVSPAPKGDELDLATHANETVSPACHAQQGNQSRP